MLRKLSEIKLDETKLIQQIVKDYFHQDAKLEPFVNAWHTHDGLEKILSERSFDSFKRPILVQHLYSQYAEAELELSEESLTSKQINLLSEPNTYTVTTGHQLSLFGGTLFMAYKILTAIKLANNLRIQYPDKNFIPILWLASEDHDFEEIKSTHLFGKDFVWEKDSKNRPTGKVDLEGITQLINDISSSLGEGEIAKEWAQEMKIAYDEKYDLGQATIRFYHHLFASFGLVILDPNAKELKNLFRQTMRRDILEQRTFSVQTETDKVLAENYKLQINARPINFFFLDDTVGRKMLKFKDGAYFFEENSKVFTPSEIEDLIENSPERFSPNVNLRPVYQETILPNLAYVGGPAEVAYWLQLKSVFEANEIPYPIVLVRFMNLILGKGMIEKIEKVGFELSELIEDENKVSELVIDKSNPIPFQEQFEDILDKFQTLVEETRNLDQAISKEFLQTKLSLKDQFKSKKSILRNAMEANEQIQIEKVLKLRSRIFPKGIFQERIETLMQLESSINKKILNELLEFVEPFSGKLLISTH
ncbi:MAG: bacillithiol biosynthesis cysteine-adding enzyme BshC [Bacteroidia bacterium]|nr:bacillithiol biosynthesis cysteine-adding enzyme BshC [Bacteroidia bacterium]MCF8428134.1 bacillithiol biosynthesis cysteine-adding enzyme BshC [Bacteroidia bacterium]